MIFTVENIKNYLDFLINEKNLYVTLHGAGINKSSLAPYNIHTNPYCLYVKSFCENWDECIKRQSAVYKPTALSASADTKEARKSATMPQTSIQ